MSRAYRIQLAESLRRHIQVEDGVRARLELLPLLPPQALGELLAAELSERGFERDGQRTCRQEPDGVVVSVELATGEVTASLLASRELSLEAQRNDRVLEESRVQAELRIKQQLQASLEKKAQAAEDALKQDVTDRLEARLQDLREELDGVVNRVTVKALKTRAAELGEIEEISEDPQSGSLTIRVKL